MLLIIDDAVELVRRLRPYVRQIALGDPDLARQLRKASKSIALNLSEGSGVSGRRRVSHYRIALGSARETAVALRLAAAEGLIDELDGPTADLLDKVQRVGSRLTRY